jgi:hypothetical protein
MTNTNEFVSTQWVEFPSIEGKHASTSPFLPIEHYCVIADRVFISFLKAYRRLYVEGDDSMAQRVSVLGKRLSDFIHVVLPSHPDYNIETEERMNDIDTQLKSYLRRFEENHEYYQGEEFDIFKIHIHNTCNLSSLIESSEDDECRVCGEEVQSYEIESRDESDPILENSSEFRINDTTEKVLLKYVDVEIEGSTDNSSVSSTSIDGSFVSNISSAIFEPVKLSIDEHDDLCFEEEVFADQNDTKFDGDQVFSIDDIGKAVDEAQLESVASKDILELHPEQNDSAMDELDNNNNDIDYSFQALLSHWKLHELQNVKKNAND